MSTAIVSQTEHTPRIFLETPDGRTGLAGYGIGMGSSTGFHLLRERDADGSVTYGALELESPFRNPSHPINVATVGDKWSFPVEGERTTTEYEYMGVHKRLRYELIGDTDDVRTIIVAVFSAAAQVDDDAVSK